MAKKASSNISELEKILSLYDGNFYDLEKDLQKLKLQKKSQGKRNNTSPVLVKLEGVDRRYKTAKNEVVAVDKVSLEIREGEFVALIGPSGSGKSTVLNLISGLDSPDAGSVVIDGTDITKLSPNQRAVFRAKHIGFVFQFFYLQPFLNLLTNVEVPAMFLKTSRASRKVAAEKLIESVGLSDRKLHRPKELSGGQMQRAAVARALLNNPKLILADEPTGNLDSKSAQDVMDLFEKVRKEFGATVIVVTHDHKIAERADYSIELVDGRIA